MTSFYSDGTITLTNGSAVVTGNGTAWKTALVTSGWLLVKAAEGNVLPILSVDTNAQITAEWEWKGADGTYDYCIQRDSDQVRDNAENSKNLVALLNQIRNGLAFKYDASGLLADRALFDARPKGFAYLVVGGTTADLYVKRSNTSGDWAGPYAYGKGDKGDKGDGGPYTTITIGPTYTLPAGSPAQVIATPINATTVQFSFALPRGVDGNGAGDMVKSVYDPTGQQRDIFGDLSTRSRVMDFVQGMGLSASGGQALLIDAGKAQGSGLYCALSGPLTKNIGAAWQKGSDVGSLDTGAVAGSQCYHVHVIRQNTTGDCDILTSLNAFVPTVPAGWTRIGRIGSVLTASNGAIRPFRQSGDYFVLSAASRDFSSTQNVAMVLSISVPTQVTTLAMLRLAGISTTGAAFVIDTDNLRGQFNGNLFTYVNGLNLTYGNQINLNTIGTPHPTEPWAVDTVGWIETTVRRI